MIWKLVDINELMKVYEVPLSFVEHHIDILGPDIRRAFTGLLVLCFFYLDVIFTLMYTECFITNNRQLLKLLQSCWYFRLKII